MLNMSIGETFSRPPTSAFRLRLTRRRCLWVDIAALLPDLSVVVAGRSTDCRTLAAARRAAAQRHLLAIRAREIVATTVIWGCVLVFKKLLHRTNVFLKVCINYKVNFRSYPETKLRKYLQQEQDRGFPILNIKCAGVYQSAR